MGTPTPPRFVNLQTGRVSVFDENGRNLTVLPFKERDRYPDGVFVVEGEHYRKFVGPRGPLYTFPETPASAPAPSAAAPAASAPAAPAAPVPAQRAEDAAALAAESGRWKGTGAVIRNGEPVGDVPVAPALTPVARAQAAEHDAIRDLMKTTISAGFERAGINTYEDVMAASDDKLLAVKGVTKGLLPQLRQFAHSEIAKANAAERTKPGKPSKPAKAEKPAEPVRKRR